MSIYTCALDYFEKREWNIEAEAEEGRILTQVIGDNAEWGCVILAEETTFIVYSVAPIQTPPERLSEMMSYITQVNFGLPMGCFELDISDGEVRFRTSVDFEFSEPTTAMVHNAVMNNLTAMDHYVPGALAIATEGVSAADALAKAVAELDD